MAPLAENIESALRAAIQETIDEGNEDALTVRYVRNKVTELLRLDDGFFLTVDWKARSKAFINDCAGELLDVKQQKATAPIEVAAKSTKNNAVQAKPAPKRAAPTDKLRPTKRQKNTTPSEEEDEDEVTESSEEAIESPVSEFDDSDISEPPKAKKNTNIKSRLKARAKAPAKRQTKRKVQYTSTEDETSDSESDGEESDAPSIPPKSATKNKASSKQKSKSQVVDSEEESRGEELARKKAKSNKHKAKNTIIEPNDASNEVQTPKNEEFETKKIVSGTTKYKSKQVIVESDSESEEESETEKNIFDTRDYKSKQTTVGSDSKPAPETSFNAKPPPPQSPYKTPSVSPLGPAIWSDGDSTPNTRSNKKPTADDSDDENIGATHIDSESEMSVVLDETPRSKKKKTARRSTSGNPETAREQTKLSADEALIKTLQAQLVKCGIRKIWQFELRQYGDEAKAKVRHLQGMLKDIGMTGRFSEQRAKELKELRELQADLEAVREGEKAWGLESGRRSRGGPRKSLKESSGEDEDEDEDGGGGGDGGKEKAKPSKAAQAKQELAFLGDEESDSD